MNVTVAQSGFLATVQDLGRTGYRQSGVSLGGALDSFALRVANALVGNDETAAGLEATLGTLHLRFADERIVAWCGGAFSVRIGENNLSAGHAGLVAKGEELTMTAPQTGARAWLAISGGIDVPMVLGSRSTDLRGNFGGYEGRALRDGDQLPLGEQSTLARDVGQVVRERKIAEWTAPANWVGAGTRECFLRVIRGPEWNQFAPDAQTSLIGQSFTVTNDSDRMGARLDGLALERIKQQDLLSEAVAPGSIQVPPSGKPILLLGDCQTIGGYPRIAHVITVDLPIAAQLWPGKNVRFHEISLVEAQSLLREREEDFARFRVGIELRSN